MVTPRHPPYLEYMTAIESVCSKLGQQDAGELRADINRVLRSFHPPKPNLTRAQAQALRKLKRDRDRLVLTANKGVGMVIMDRQDYINKSNQLLAQPAYRAIPRYPTNNPELLQKELINILKRVKNQTGLDNNTNKAMYPTGCGAPKFYALPKIHKQDTCKGARIGCSALVYRYNYRKLRFSLYSGAVTTKAFTMAVFLYYPLSLALWSILCLMPLA